ncbi:MAG: endonuclease domain-containing protein [Arachnia sp.]
MTSVARTVFDLAAGMPLPQALVVGDAAARVLVSHMIARPRRADFGSARYGDAARELLGDAAGSKPRTSWAETVDQVNPARESPPESLTAGHLALAGFPTAEYQHRVDSPIGRLYPDFYWPEQRLIGECDGAVKYRDSQSYVHEKQREQVLRDMGFNVVRWLAREIMLTPEVVVGRIGRALGL